MNAKPKAIDARAMLICDCRIFKRRFRIATRRDMVP